MRREAGLIGSGTPYEMPVEERRAESDNIDDELRNAILMGEMEAMRYEGSDEASGSEPQIRR